MKLNKTIQITILTSVIVLLQLSSLFIYPLIFGNGISCFWRGCFGIPCPGCGITRATIALIHGDFKRAFYMQPLIFILPFAAGGFGYFHFIKKNKEIANRILIILVILFLLTWIIRMILFFPHYEPMNGNESHLFHF